MNSFEEVFECVKKYCLTSGKIIESAYNIWIDPISAIQLDGSKAILFVQSDFQRGIILQNFEGVLKEGFQKTLGFAVDIEILTEEDMKNSSNFTKKLLLLFMVLAIGFIGGLLGNLTSSKLSNTIW